MITLRFNGKQAGKVEDFVSAIVNKMDFNAGPMTGRALHHPGWPIYGELPEQYQASVTQADYLVLSYSTPIMWHNAAGGWVCPEHFYSATTSKHQRMCQAAMERIEADTPQRVTMTEIPRTPNPFDLFGE